MTTFLIITTLVLLFANQVHSNALSRQALRKVEVCEDTIVLHVKLTQRDLVDMGAFVEGANTRLEEVLS